VHREHMNVAISAAARGDKVAVFAETVERVQGIANEIMEATPGELVERVSRLNGNHYMDFYGGGRIRFLSTHPNARGGRGLSLDRVFVPIGTSPDALMEIVPALNTSREGVLTGY
jgi:hypothetical protein